MAQLEADSHRAAQVEILNRLPEVRWDRTAGTDQSRAVYGWVDKPGSIRSDFVVLLFTEDKAFHPDQALQLVTSSTTWSETFTERLFGPDAHYPCVPVTEHYAGAGLRTVRGRVNLADSPSLGQ